jgi:hypothetical protein
VQNAHTSFCRDDHSTHAQPETLTDLAEKPETNGETVIACRMRRQRPEDERDGGRVATTLAGGRPSRWWLVGAADGCDDGQAAVATVAGRAALAMVAGRTTLSMVAAVDERHSGRVAAPHDGGRLALQTVARRRSRRRLRGRPRNGGRPSQRWLVGVADGGDGGRPTLATVATVAGWSSQTALADGGHADGARDGGCGGRTRRRLGGRPS